MLRIGGFEVPDATLSDSIDVVRRAHRAFGPSFSRDALAGVLKLRGRGGWFAAVIGSLRLWGLAEGRGLLRLTPNGLRLAKAESAGELSAGRRAAVLAVPLLREITERSPGPMPARTDLALMLAEITGADAGRIHSSLPQVRRVLADSWPEDRVLHSHADDRLAATDRTLPGVPAIELSFSGGRLSLPETVDNLELTASLLRRRAAELSAGATGRAAEQESET